MENAATASDGQKRRVCYLYEPEISNFSWGTERIGMVHDLIHRYNLQRHMEISRPNLAGVFDFTQFHSLEYAELLASLTSESIKDPSISLKLSRFNVNVNLNENGLFDYCRAYAGGSITAAGKLNRQKSDIVINWSGGMSCAKSDKASDFGFVNDIVLGILELLNTFKRVMYIDIGYNHGDGVEDVFYDTDRVMTISFHINGNTGNIRDVGVQEGKYYSLNAPLKDGLNDASLRSLFVPVIQKAMEFYQPEVIVFQCGADSLAGDPHGTFNLTVKGHGDCVQYIRSFNVPLMLLGGGGSNLPNVVRCWCYETSVAVGEQLDNNLPVNDSEYKHYFAPDYKLHVSPKIKQNLNTPIDIATIRDRLLMQLSNVRHAPSVQFQDTPSTSQATEAGEVDLEMRL